MSAERLQKVLASAGIASRRECEDLINAGRVSVNGKAVRVLGTRVDPEHDEIAVDGRPIGRISPRTYVMLHKPVAVVSTADDPQRRPTVVEMVDLPARLFPVGRLDYDSEGLLLLTDDGELTQRLTHPSYEVEKEYRALLDRAPSPDAIRQWRAGVELDGAPTAPAWVELLENTEDGAWVRVVLHEGRKRQIREMAGLLGYEVRRLIRVREGSLSLGELPPGEWRRLTDEEVEALWVHVGGRDADGPRGDLHERSVGTGEHPRRRPWQEHAPSSRDVRQEAGDREPRRPARPDGPGDQRRDARGERPGRERPALRRAEGYGPARPREPRGEDGPPREDRGYDGPRREDRPYRGQREDGPPREDRGYDGPRREDRPYQGQREDGPRREDRSYRGQREDGPRRDDRGSGGPRREDGPRRDDRGYAGPRREDSRERSGYGGPRRDDRGYAGPRREDSRERSGYGGPRRDDRPYGGPRREESRDRGGYGGPRRDDRGYAGPRREDSRERSGYGGPRRDDRSYGGRGQRRDEERGAGRGDQYRDRYRDGERGADPNERRPDRPEQGGERPPSGGQGRAGPGREWHVRQEREQRDHQQRLNNPRGKRGVPPRRSGFPFRSKPKDDRDER